MLRNAEVGAYVFPIKPEFSNWRDEQEAWQKTAALFDLSHHMTDIYFEGPDVMRLLTDLASIALPLSVPAKPNKLFAVTPKGT